MSKINNYTLEIRKAAQRIVELNTSMNGLASQLKDTYPAEMPKELKNSYESLNIAFINAIRDEAKYLLSLK